MSRGQHGSCIGIQGLHRSRSAEGPIADEVGWLAASCHSISSLFSYIAIRREPEPSRFEGWADRIFLAGLVCLVLAVFTLAATRL